MYRFRSDLALVGQQRGAVASRRAVFAAILRGCANQQSTHSPRRDPSNGRLDGVLYWSLPCLGNAMPVEKWLVIRDRAQPSLGFASQPQHTGSARPADEERCPNPQPTLLKVDYSQGTTRKLADCRRATRCSCGSPARRRHHDLDRHLRELQRPAPDITTPCYPENRQTR